MANKKRRARSAGKASAASSASSTPPAPQSQAPSQRAVLLKSSLRLVALLSATMVALLVFELLQASLGFWPALGIAFGVGLVARLLFAWLERLWLGAAARRAIAQTPRRTEQ